MDKLPGGVLRVFFLDFGDYAEVPAKDVFQLPPELLIQEIQTRCLTMLDVPVVFPEHFSNDLIEFEVRKAICLVF